MKNNVFLYAVACSEFPIIKCPKGNAYSTNSNFTLK